jgi:acetylornithine deacetylase/succinyl-diaminopimelate desuccinylase-like protein
MPTSASDMNPWWDLLKDAVPRAGGKLGAPMIRPSAADSRYIRNLGIPAFTFSPMSNTPSLLHDHNEVLSPSFQIPSAPISFLKLQYCDSAVDNLFSTIYL